MTEITDLSTTDSSNTSISGESLDGAIANMGRMDNTLQATMGMLARSIRTNVMRIIDFTDPTKRIKFNLTGLPAGTERELTAPYYSGTLGLVSDIRGQIYGLTLSNNAVDITNDIDIAAGAAVDTTGAVSMLLATSLTKRLDAAWAVGSGNGWLDTGSISNATYHVFLIRRPDTGVVDSLASLSPTAPTLPANYTQFRRIGSIVRTAGAILAFVQLGDEFLARNPGLDLSLANPGTSAITIPLRLPTGIKVGALIRSRVVNSSGSNIAYAIFSSFDIVDAAPSQNTAPLGDTAGALAASGSSNTPAATLGPIRTDTSGNIRGRLSDSSAAITLYVSCYGWIDTRGRFG